MPASTRGHGDADCRRFDFTFQRLNHDVIRLSQTPVESLITTIRVGFGLSVLRRAVTGAAIVLALLAQLIVGAGRDAQVCVCSSGISIEAQQTPCCAEELQITVDESVCRDCHLLPLPDPVLAMAQPQASLAVPALTQAWSLAVILERSSPPMLTSTRQRERPPAAFHLRRLRSVLLTC